MTVGASPVAQTVITTYRVLKPTVRSYDVSMLAIWTLCNASNNKNNQLPSAMR